MLAFSRTGRTLRRRSLSLRKKMLYTLRLRLGLVVRRTEGGEKDMVAIEYLLEVRKSEVCCRLILGKFGFCGRWRRSAMGEEIYIIGSIFA